MPDSTGGADAVEQSGRTRLGDRPHPTAELLGEQAALLSEAEYEKFLRGERGKGIRSPVSVAGKIVQEFARCVFHRYLTKIHALPWPSEEELQSLDVAGLRTLLAKLRATASTFQLLADDWQQRYRKSRRQPSKTERYEVMHRLKLCPWMR